MKKIILLVLLSFVLFSCGGSKDSTFKHGDTVIISQECLVSVGEDDNYEQLTKYCVRKDEVGVKNMVLNCTAKVLKQGETAVVVDMSFGKTKIRLSDGTEVWCASEFLK